MAIRSSFFNSVAGDKIYNAEDFASYFASFIANGVFPTPATNLQVSQLTNLQTFIRPGKGWINGYYVVNDSDFTLQHTAADGSLDRIDRVVMALNLSTRDITFYVKRGTPSASPTAPALVRDGTLTELALADVRVNRGTLSITQSNITDTRPNASLCGFVKGVVQEIDTTNLFAQYDSSFTDFLSGLQDTLSGDVAYNLLQLIEANENALDQHVNNQNIHITSAERTNWNSKVSPNLYSTNTVSGLARVGEGLLSGANGLISLDSNNVPKNLKLVQTIPVTTALTSTSRLSITNVSQYDFLKIVIVGGSAVETVSTVRLTTASPAYSSKYTFSSTGLNSSPAFGDLLNIGGMGPISRVSNIEINIWWNGIQSVITAISSYSPASSQGNIELCRGYHGIKILSPELRFSAGLAAGSTILIYGGDYN